ncbi:Lrp/AsnC family transcriptional regulator [Hazenella sp. IB182357]|uniref:Lrp/AsnC family transcriptional regulator n=1 Tax=Polycladospora coralii TaxID=2771432 RepID=A0A926RSU6_9BACL|nr:Lrp/AsnC family transcriptional regulator [Polycladospora coralii]MBD1370753.1 Lrp/AsnC family transcriptional regulator [Polycladospora coralii]MBS7529691.1 Lrp/AsnC family transcriptional regulator [Polycladospora coralii]
MSAKLEHAVLSLLEENARIELDQIATMLDEDKEIIIQIVDELEKKGVIVKYGTLINWQKASTKKVAALIDVKVTPQRGHGFDAIAKRIYLFPEVRSVYLMSGSYDLSVALEVDSMEAVGKFVTEKLAPIDSVVSTMTHFVMKKYKEDGVILDEPEKDERLVITP